MATLLLVVWSLLCFIIGTNGEMCQDDLSSSYLCIFGCCQTEGYGTYGTVYIYCCLSNRAGIAIISACIVVFFSILGCICRVLYRNKRRPPVTNQYGASSVSIVGNTTDQYSYNNPQMMSTAAPPPPYPGLPETASPNKKFTY